MAVATNKRSVMTLHSGLDIDSHKVRIVLAEKDIFHDVIAQTKTEDLFELNPYGKVPTLVDRDLVLYNSNIIMEYLDERFPHPPLMPVYPVARAKARLIIHRLDVEWKPLIHKLNSEKSSEANMAIKELTSHIVQLVPLFNSSPFFLGDEFTLVDCCMAPILWRMPAWGITLAPAEAKAINKYAERIFKRDSFQASLIEAEHELRKQDKIETTKEDS